MSRLLALDVDGTLLTSAEELTERTRSALSRAEDEGWHVALVTGRPLPLALPVLHDLGLGRYVVAANGATVADAGTASVLFQASLAGEVAVEAIARVRRSVPGVGLAVTTASGFFREPGFDVLAPLSRTEGVQVRDATPDPREAVHSIVLFVGHLDALALQAQVAAILPDGVVATPSGLPGSVELVAPGVHKGRGVAELSARVGVPQQRVVAFGDGLNDHEMLMWAGLGVAMGNAAQATKAVADEVTASNDDDGVAVVVERLLAEGRQDGEKGPEGGP